jgi:hypothetical protein
MIEPSIEEPQKRDRITKIPNGSSTICTVKRPLPCTDLYEFDDIVLNE